MKYIKTFEKIIIRKPYNVGDYIIVTTKHYNIDNKLMVVHHINYYFKDYAYVCNEPNKDDDFYEIGEKDIIRKASNVEIKAIKYNI